MWRPPATRGMACFSLLFVLPIIVSGVRDGDSRLVGRPALSTGLVVARGGSVDVGSKLSQLLNADVPSASRGPCTAQTFRSGMYLLVGRVVPETFSCGGMRTAAQYLHSGSPMLDSDIIGLSVFRSVGNDTAAITVYIHITVVNQTEPIIEEGNSRATVNEFMGRTLPFSRQNLNFVSEPGAASCVAKYSRSASSWPAVGQLLLRNADGAYEVAGNFELPCHQLVDNESIVYEHLSPPSPDMDYVPLEVQLSGPATAWQTSSGKTHSAVAIQRFYLPVRIAGGLPNQPPRAAFLGAYIMDVDEFALTTVVSGVLSAADEETAAGQLMFNISKPPSGGHFVHLSDHTEPIASFRQEEMEDGMIAYWPPEKGYSTKKIYEAEFRVHDAHFAWSSPIVLHIAVRPSSSKAPRVAVNAAMSVLEGQGRSLDQRHFRLVGSGDMGSVSVYVFGGPRHGKLELNGQTAMRFTQLDVDAGRVRYVHDDSNSVRDDVDLRISDGKHTIRTKFFINVIPKDDTPPVIVRNVEARLREGETVRISSAFLLAADEDSDAEKIRFIITKPPAGGELLRKINQREAGSVVKAFTNRDIARGYIYYKHFGGELHEDMFEFSVADSDTEPVNTSPGHIFRIRVAPIDDTPPEPVPGLNRSVSVLETELLLLSTNILCYSDGGETEDDDIFYTVARAPFYVDYRGSSDAGKIVSTRGILVMEKDPRLPPLSSFYQRDLKHGSIAYVPPASDVGMSARLVRFSVVASDDAQNSALPLDVDIAVLPVDNQPPRVTMHRAIKVFENGSEILSSADLAVSDEDTSLSRMKLYLGNVPEFGQLHVNGRINAKQFSLQDIQEGNVRYVHGGNEFSPADEFSLIVSDGYHNSSVTCHVEIVLINDKSPYFKHGLVKTLFLPEGSYIVLSTENLAAADEDTNNATLRFSVLVDGIYGSLYLDNRSVTFQFTQQDVMSGRISYGAFLKEVGPQAVSDRITVGVLEPNEGVPAAGTWPSDRSAQLTFIVHPVNNQTPRLASSDANLEVKEAGSTQLTPSLLVVDDPDTAAEDLHLVLLEQPKWGFFESRGLAPGSELSMAGRRLNTFSYADVLSGLIYYVQSVHANLEPREDSALVYVSDSASNSTAVRLHVRITGVNDEAPTIQVGNFSVLEGKEVAINNITFTDLDLPRDVLRLSVSELPKHGRLMLTLQAKDGRGKATTHELPIKSSFDPKDLGVSVHLTYRHDGSERFADYFVLQVTDGIHRVERRVDIEARPQNDAAPIIIKNAGALLYYNETVVISRSMLLAQDEDSSDKDIFYILTRMPTRGNVELLQSHRGAADNELGKSWLTLRAGDKFSQEEINRGRLRYTNLQVSTADKTADLFEFKLSDGTNIRSKEAFEIEVRKSKALPAIRITSDSPILVSYGAQAVVTTRELNAHDASDMHAGLVYAVRSPPKHGRLERLLSAGKPTVAMHALPSFSSVTSFTQVDLASGRIWYNHCGCGNATSDSIEMVVQSSAPSDRREAALVVAVKIASAPSELPALRISQPVLVRPGGLINMADVLHVSFANNRERNLTISLTGAPRYGKVVIDEQSVMSFGLHDLRMRRVLYVRGSQSTQQENIGLRLSDARSGLHTLNGSVQSETTMIIGIDSDKGQGLSAACSDVSLYPPRSLEAVGAGRQGFVISPNNIRIQQQHCDTSGLTYQLVSAPLFGSLIKMDRSSILAGARFSQSDLSRGLLYAMKNISGAISNDSFSFTISANGQSSKKIYSLPLTWSTFEFTQTSVSVCESARSLVVRVRRTGARSGTAFVTIAATGQTAKEGEDFSLERYQQLQFEPDIAEVSYKIAITADAISEGSESFRLSLTSPANAILGAVTQMTVIIEDQQSGGCSRSQADAGGSAEGRAARRYYRESRKSYDRSVESLATAARGFQWPQPGDEKGRAVASGRGEKANAG